MRVCPSVRRSVSPSTCRSVRPLVRRSVCWSVGPSVGFCKNRLIHRKIIVFCMSMHIYCMSIHSLVCPPIILSVCPLFCQSVCPSIHPYVCNHIVKIAKSIAKSSKINLKSMVQFNGNRSSIKRILKRKLH